MAIAFFFLLAEPLILMKILMINSIKQRMQVDTFGVQQRT